MATQRTSLLTAASHAKPNYHLLELTPDLVQFFEPLVSEGRDEGDQQGGKKRTRDTSDEGQPRQRPSLCIKGRRNDEAVLCTDTQTFSIRQVKQSNSLLFCTLDAAKQSDVSTITVQDNVTEILELLPIVARSGRIATLLGPSAYAGEDEEDRDGAVQARRLYTPQQVASVVQASAAELKAGLCQAYVVEMDGYLRMMDRQYLARAISVLLSYIDRLSLSADRILLGSAMTTLSELHGMRREAAEAMLCQWFGQERTENSAGATKARNVADVEVSLSPKEIVQFVGLHLLEQKANRTPLEHDDFVKAWSDEVGPLLSDKVDVRLLDGNYLLYPEPPAVASKTDPLRIQHFPSADLPLDIALRFQTLFTKRAQWTADTLTPFLVDVAVDAKRRDALLLKFARSSYVQMPAVESKQERRARLLSGNATAPTRNVQIYSARLRYA